MAVSPLLRVEPWVLRAPVHCGMTTRVGFPAAGTGDDDRHSRAASRTLLARGLARAVEDMAWVKQVHGAAVLDAAHGGPRGEADALVTDDPNPVLLVSIADCAPVALWDPETTVRAIAHAGWRGAVAGVVEAAVDAMVARGASADRIAAWIGPRIGPAHFEVGPEVAERFDPEDVLAPGADGRVKPHVDLGAAIARRLARRGVAHVLRSADCTYAREDLYWSYRRDGGLCGRQIAWIAAR